MFYFYFYYYSNYILSALRQTSVIKQMPCQSVSAHSMTENLTVWQFYLLVYYIYKVSVFKLCFFLKENCKCRINLYMHYVYIIFATETK